ncbi:RNA polymerase sigma factor [Candidatus Woesebacteria bacterium]|nr:RNA polymerase sigma factor [Candidatus Woesebacteria bacterium]
MQYEKLSTHFKDNEFSGDQKRVYEFLQCNKELIANFILKHIGKQPSYTTGDENFVFEIVVMKCLKHASEIENHATQRYIFTVAETSSIDYIRKARVESRIFKDVPDDSLERIATTSTKQVQKLDYDEIPNLIIEMQTRELMLALIGRINPNFANPLILFYYYGLPYDRIAEELGIEVGTVKSRIHRGKESLGAMIKDHNPFATDLTALACPPVRA